MLCNACLSVPTVNCHKLRLLLSKVVVVTAVRLQISRYGVVCMRHVSNIVYAVARACAKLSFPPCKGAVCKDREAQSVNPLERNAAAGGFHLLLLCLVRYNL